MFRTFVRSAVPCILNIYSIHTWRAMSPCSISMFLIFRSFRRSMDIFSFPMSKLSRLYFSLFRQTTVCVLYFCSFRRSLDIRHFQCPNLAGIQSIFRTFVRSAVPWILNISSIQTWRAMSPCSMSMFNIFRSFRRSVDIFSFPMSKLSRLQSAFRI